jgi:hypothetical protein
MRILYIDIQRVIETGGSSEEEGVYAAREEALTLEKYLTARPEKMSATLAPRPNSG